MSKCPDLEYPFIMSSAKDGSATNIIMDHNPVSVEWIKEVRVFRHFHFAWNSLSPRLRLKELEWQIWLSDIT